MTEIGQLIESVDRMTEAAGDIEKKLKTSRRIQLALGALIGLTMASLIGLVFVVIQLFGLVDDFQQSQLAGCERGNTLREDVVEFSQQENITFTRALQRLTGATDVEVETFLQYLEEEREIPASFQPINCESVY